MAVSNDTLPVNGSINTCERCNEAQATLRIRADHVCQTCFSQYLTTKAVKRIETYRVRGLTAKSPRKLLLPLSFGTSSSTLLYLLDQYLQGQHNRMKRVSYELFVVHVDLFVDPKDRNASAILLKKYQTRFPRHKYSSFGLEEALGLENIDWKALGVLDAPGEGPERPESGKLQEIIGSMTSVTSRADIVATLLNRLLVDVSKRNNCDSILFGDSTTRLAEKTLTETAKGRGFSLPWQVSDGMTPYGIVFNYPLRDLLKKELVTFSTLTSTPLTDLIIPQEASSHISASSKLTTIDDLMAQYFESVEENYPSIVANVVRTSSKLKPLPGNDTTDCGLCGLPVAVGTHGISGWGGDQNSGPLLETDSSHDNKFCYGCSRSIND